MDKQEEIITELKAISPLLASMEKVNIFQVPDDYFAHLDSIILTNIFLQQEEKNTFQKVPQGYFESLSERILSKVKAEKTETATEEIKALSPALFYLKEENVFTVPENYFDHLNDRILDKINNRKAKVVSISSARKWFKYAAAAVVAGIVAIFSSQVLNDNSASVHKETVTASTNIPAYIQQSSQYKTPEQLNAGIASLSDEEIVNYLETTGTILDEETITKNMDTKELPDVNDYLMDENTLNKFLNSDVENTNKNKQ